MDPKRRQTILIAAAAIFAIYGLFQLPGLLKERHAGPGGMPGAGGLRAFIAQTTARIISSRPGAYDQYVMRMAGSQWGRDPFSGTLLTAGASGGKDSAETMPHFAYNGFVQRGNRRVAVINNREYMAGDQLEEKGFFVEKISPSKVIIKNKKAGSAFEIPLSEIE